MSAYDINYFIKDFSDRTYENIAVVKEYNEKYYVTQLLNSLLGIIIIPNEAFYDNGMGNNRQIRKLCKKELRLLDSFVERCITSNRYYCNYKMEHTAFQFLKHIRNSMAHGGDRGLIFYPLNECRKEEDVQIDSVLFYDENKGDKSQKFCVKLYVDEIEELVLLAKNLYQKYETKNTRKGWEKKVSECENLFCIKHNLMKVNYKKIGG